MTCDEAVALLDDYADGLLTPERTAALEAHLERCPRLPGRTRESPGVAGRREGLPRSITPPPGTWAAIQQGIESRTRPDVVPLAAHRSRIRIAWLVAAAVVLMVLSSAVTSLWIKRGGEGQGFAASQAEYAQATAELAQKIEKNPAGLSPRTLAILDRNLAIMDAAIREAEQALKTDPGDSTLEEMLLARYQQRLELLQRAARAGQES